MKIIITTTGLLLLGAMVYYGYNYSKEKNIDTYQEKYRDEVVSKVKSVSTDILDDMEKDITVKSSIIEEIPADELLEEEQRIEADKDADIIENEDKHLPEDIDKFIAEQEVLIAVEAEKEPTVEKSEDEEKQIELIDDGAKARLGNQDKMIKRDVAILEREEKLAETEEDKIIREEDAKMKAAMAE